MYWGRGKGAIRKGRQGGCHGRPFFDLALVRLVSQNVSNSRSESLEVGEKAQGHSGALLNTPADSGHLWPAPQYRLLLNEEANIWGR